MAFQSRDAASCSKLESYSRIKGTEIRSAKMSIISTRIREEESQETDLRIMESADELALQAAAFFAEQAKQAIAERGVFFVLLSGGKTPMRMFERLSKLSLAWDKIHLFWGDERMVPPENPENNFHNARQSLLSRIKIPEANVHRVRTEAGSPDEKGAAEVARLYEQEMRKWFSNGQWPRFDLAVQGMGPDGHTASLFPDSPHELDSPDWVIAPYVEKMGMFRISVSLSVLNAARVVLFLVSGQEKSEIVRKVLKDPKAHRGLLPAERVQPAQGQVFWFLDRAAASRL
jgi:6-phosphogluconolactonase